MRQYQARNNLSVDGIVGPNTWASLCTVPNTGVLEPFQCQGGYRPSPTYTDRIKKRAFHSGGKSYYDLAVEVGIEKNVHPALLTTHMILESSMGAVNSCTSTGKTALTGCQWYVSCASGCKCNGWSVYSDSDQLKCTANTDRNAANFQGAYAKCSSYKNDPGKMWKCILCTYQGNYDKDIQLNDNDPRYFTKDGTCAYAENFKKNYCDWKAYFAYYEGI